MALALSFPKVSYSLQLLSFPSPHCTWDPSQFTSLLLCPILMESYPKSAVHSQVSCLGLSIPLFYECREVKGLFTV